MSQIYFGCQTYSWQMSYQKYADNLPHIMHTMKQAGFSGIEAEVCMMGKYFENWETYAELLKEHCLSYAAMALPLDWHHAKETDEEYAMAQKAIAFLKHFPGTLLLLCHLPGKDRNNLRQRQNNQLNCISAIAQRAKDEGVKTAFHPNSSYGSAFRTQEDYDYMLNYIGKTYVGYCPDAGHIAHGNMDPVKLISDYSSLVSHVHFKDMDSEGVWQSMGQGCIDFPQIVKHLNQADYKGWIMVEEESAQAEIDPDAVTANNGIYLKEKLFPVVKP